MLASSEIQVKNPDAATNWVWGAFKMPGTILHDLHRLWLQRGGSDEYVGTLINAWVARGGAAWGARAGESYVDVGTLHGYREALGLLSKQAPGEGPAPARFRQRTLGAGRLALEGRGS